MKLFGSSGTRGVAIAELTPEFALRVAKGAGSVWDDGRVAVARDTRTTGELFANAVASGLAATGHDVDRLGVTPTPAACRYAAREGVPCVLVTASHNPPEFNGLKLVDADGVETGVDGLERVEAHVLAEDFDEVGWDGAGATERVDDADDAYLAALHGAVDGERIAAADLTVAVDPGHGAGALTNPRFYRELGCDVLTVNAQPDGRFPGRLPEPVPEHLDGLRRLVRTTDADLGIAHDGDADRAIFVDEDGRYVEGDASLAALADEALEPGDATVTAVSTSQRLVDVCERIGADLEFTAVGATSIITRVEELREAGRRVPVAGEGNGGVFFPEEALVRDGALIAARFLELVAERPASEVVAPYEEYHNVRLDLAYDDRDELDAMLSAAGRHADAAAAELDTTDGYRLDYGGAWVLVRPSGTEPKVRIYAEARDEDRARDLAAGARDAVADAG